MAELKQIALRIFRETMAAIDVAETMRRKISVRGTTLRVAESEFDLAAFERVCVVALGKASRAMADGLLSVLPAGLRLEGIVVAPAGAPMAAKGAAHPPLAGWKYFFSGIPCRMRRVGKPRKPSWSS